MKISTDRVEKTRTCKNSIGTRIFESRAGLLTNVIPSKPFAIKLLILVVTCKFDKETDYRLYDSWGSDR